MRPRSVSLETIFDLYRELPNPRITFLPAQLRHALLAVLGITERKDPKSMLRYFAVVADVKKCGFALSGAEWNTAMSFASRYVGRTSEVEAEAALHMWREMEHDAGIKGSEVTFNILFDAASKAGKFALAEMIYQEMKTRGIHFNRYHHVSLIHFFGLKMNASGVTAAYKQMVESGEIIDSLVLNCVMVGLLRSGDEAAAERIYENMKISDARSKLIPERNYAFDKMVTKTMMMFARLGRAHPDMRPGLQDAGVTSPNLETYRILLNHFGVRLGKMSKVAQYLDEMKFFRVPLHGAIFLAIFKGFSVHGRAHGSDWSLQRLTSVWVAFLDALDGGAEGLHISTWMAMWILMAFARHSKSKEQLLAVYDDLKDRWDFDATNSNFMLEFFHKLLSKNGLSVDDISTSTFALEPGARENEDT
jgi:pentatricopeptide repeat protein